jgi:hypothetical protein
VNESAKLAGIYTVEYQVIGAGTYQMSVTVDGKHVEGSPFDVNATKDAAPAPKKEEAAPAASSELPSPALSASLKTATGSAIVYTAKGDGLTEAVAGKPARFEISVRRHEYLFLCLLALVFMMTNIHFPNHSVSRERLVGALADDLFLFF